MNVALIDELDAKVINYEQELDWLPLASLNARTGGGMIIASCIETLLKELDSKDSGLR